MVLKRQFILAIILASLIGLTSCSPEGLSVFDIPGDVQSDPEPTTFPTPDPPSILSVCLGREPGSLFLYGDLSVSAEIIRQAIYDGPVDQVGFVFQPIILDDLPSQENGGVSVNQVEVFPGQGLVDTQGNITLLAPGVEYRPAGCYSPDCWEIYQDQASVYLDQVSVQFSIMAGIRWSDGAPLTPEDSLFSYQVAKEIYGPRGPAKLRFAADYQVLEEGDLQWTGLPGYLGIYDYAELFFTPLPGHLWANYTREELLTSPQTTITPLGWGPYRSLEWLRGDHITLIRNDYYHLGNQGWPAYDFLVFRFVQDGQEALAAYKSGECDLVVNTPGFTTYLPEILSLEKTGDLNLTFIDQPAWEQISFGIDSIERSRKLLTDPQMRNAIAMCIDKESIAASRKDAGTLADNLYHPLDPRSNPEIDSHIYQPAEGEAILESLGWSDNDLDPTTPRTGWGVAGIPWGTSLELSLLVPGVEGDSPTAEMIKEQLGLCGIGVDIQYLPAAELLAPGPEGPIFGRQFDLALFAWTTGSYHLCQIFQTGEIPGQYPAYPKGWGGANPAGFSEQGFDQACQAILTNPPDSEESRQGIQDVQSIFQTDLPALPLFYRRDVLISRPGLTGLTEGSPMPFVTIEYMD